MVRHVILWKLKEMPAAEQETVKADIKAGLEGLADVEVDEAIAPGAGRQHTRTLVGEEFGTAVLGKTRA